MRTTILTADDLTPCAVCVRGCDCTQTDPGCEHYGCWGRDRTPATCPGAEQQRENERALYAAARERISTQARVRDRLADTYWRIVTFGTLA